MSGPGAIEVDESAGRARWRDRGMPVEAEAPGAFAARRDPATGQIILLSRDGERGAVLIFSGAGERLARIEPPAGYAVSHFAAEGTAIVCQGDSSDGGWWDWHFEVDAAGLALRRTGPAY